MAQGANPSRGDLQEEYQEAVLIPRSSDRFLGVLPSCLTQIPLSLQCFMQEQE